MYGVSKIGGVVFLFFVDRLLKTLIYYVGSFFVFSRTQNMTWLNISSYQWWSMVFELLVLLVLIYYLATNYALLRVNERASLLAIVLGGISNIFDRIAYSGVIDYISLSRISFNIADVCIVGGVVYLIFTSKPTRSS